MAEREDMHLTSHHLTEGDTSQGGSQMDKEDNEDKEDKEGDEHERRAKRNKVDVSNFSILIRHLIPVHTCVAIISPFQSS